MTTATRPISPPEALPKISGRKIEGLARAMMVTQLDGGATSAWLPNEEQIAVWSAGDEHLRRYITKSRRIGVSTALDLERVLWTATCDAAGHRVRAAVIIHVEDKVKERIAQCASFAQQLGLKITPKTFSIGFTGGSEIVGVTAGGDSASRSEGFQHATWEEYAFMRPGAYGEISPSIGKGAVETIATTIDVGASNGKRAREMWRADNGFKKMFFPFEQHALYRCDPGLITDAQWDWCRAHGFTRRDSASYWLTELVPNKCEGDTQRAFREYPPTEGAMFASSDSLWIKGTPKIAVPIDGLTVQGIRGEDWPCHIYRQPKDCGACIIGVDTAQGKGQDRGVVIVVDQTDWRQVAIMSSDRILFDDLARVTLELQQLYTPAGGHAPVAIIEQGGCGDATVTSAAGLGVIHDIHTPTEESKYRGLLMAKMAVESGLLTGPIELTEECDELHRDPLTGAFKGRKDILSAYGFVATRMNQAPWLPAQPIKQSEQVVDGRRIIRNIQRQQRRR